LLTRPAAPPAGTPGLGRKEQTLDDQKLVYPAYATFARAGIRNVCVHKGLFPEAAARRFPQLLPAATCATWPRRPGTGRS
jgi:hypothetical protein